MFLRVDKRFFRPATIDRWVIVVYERLQRFTQQNADEMTAGLLASCRDVGMPYSLISSIYFLLLIHFIGIVVKDTNPLVSWQNGQGRISEVCTSTCVVY